MRSTNDVYEVLVIGGGVNGLAALFHLQRLGCKGLGLVERFGLGHQRGSSHGQSRITRSAYNEARYVRLMQVVHQQEWPRLEAATQTQLVHPTQGCFWGTPEGKFTDYAEAVARAGADADCISVQAARRRFPQFRFGRAQEVLLDRTAAVVAAADAMAAMARLNAANGVVVHTDTQVLALDPTVDPIRVETDKGVLQAERLVVAAGAWAGDLLPFVQPYVRVARQTVGYFILEGPEEDFQVGRFPVWGYLGDTDIEYYGLPSFGRPGVKLARHVIWGVEDDPDEVPAAVDITEVEFLRQFLETHFTAPVERFVDAEHCLYTNTKTEDFIIDLHPENERIAVGAGFSGHGFKFGPMTGRALAELVLYGKTTVPEFEAMRDVFSIKQD
jgi:sarcosine oxidase